MRFGAGLLENFSFSIPGSIQKRLINYALRKLLGPLLNRNLTSDDLELQLSDGRLVLTNLDLRTDIINQKLSSTGASVSLGSIATLEISIPWTNLWSGKVSVLVRDLKLHVRRNGSRTTENDITDLSSSISAGTAEVADSFLHEEEEEEVEHGIGAELPESAILQQLLDTIVANTTLDFIDSKITLEAGGNHCMVVLSIASLRSGPRDPGVRGFEAHGIALNLVSSRARPRRGSSDTERPEPSNSSRSTSMSSHDDNGLMQSMIFGREEGRSLYMSAIESDSIYYLAVDEKSVCSDESQVGACVDGFTGILTSDATGLSLDMSSEPVILAAGQSEIASFIMWFDAFNSSSDPISLAVRESETQQMRLSVNIRLSALSITFSAENDLCLGVQPTEREASSLYLFLEQIVYSRQFDTAHFSVKNFDLKIGDVLATRIRQTGQDNFLEGDLGGNARSSMSVISLQAFSVKLNAKLIQSLIKMTTYAQTIMPRQDQPYPDTAGRARSTCIKCPGLQIELDLSDELLTASFGFKVTALSSISSRKICAELDALTCSMSGFTLLRSRTTVPWQIDVVFQNVAGPRRKLDFIIYEDLFAQAGRNHKADDDILQAIQSRAKEESKTLINVAIPNLELLFDSTHPSRLQQLMNALQALAPADDSRVSSSDFSSLTSIEIQSVDCQLSTNTNKFSLQLQHLSCLVAQNLKNVDIATLDCAAITFSAIPDFAPVQKVLQEGLHKRLNDKSRMFPMLSLRMRRNLTSRLKDQYMIRLSITDMKLEYEAEMPWLDELSSIPKTSSSDRVSLQSCTVKYCLALDLTDVSIGLNPYAGSSKALLYFRKAAFNGRIDTSGKLEPTMMHAGVLDLFLIDNIEGGQNDFSTSKKVRNDNVIAPLLQLGFAHVASLETVEVNIKLAETQTPQPLTVTITGAILTLTTCADSTQTLIALLNMLHVPVVISDDLKYRLGLTAEGQIPIDVFQSIDQDAFKVIQSSHVLGNESRSDVPLGDSKLPETLALAPDKLDLEGRGGLLLVSDEEGLPTELADERYLSQSVLDLGHEKAGVCPTVVLRMKNCFAVWNVHDGYDWERTRTEIGLAIDSAVRKSQQKATKADSDSGEDDMEASESTDSNEIGDLLFNSIYIALPNGAKSEEVSEAVNKELQQAGTSETASHTTARPRHLHSVEKAQSNRFARSKVHKARIEISGVLIDFDLMNAEEGEVQNRALIEVQNFEIIDNVPTSTWRKFITQSREARIASPAGACKLDITTVRPVLGLAAAELIIKAVVAPLRLHVDQDTLEFLTRFFEFKDNTTPLPIIPAEEIFIQKFEVLPIAVQIDYKPKRVDFNSIRSGRTTEYKNFFILEDSKMILKHVVLYGICGFPRIFVLLNDIWLAHVKSNQLSSVLAGVSPIRSLASFGGGLKNLVMLPISEYQKDGRLVPGLQKGLSSFARSTGQEAVRLGAKLAVGTQGILESAESMLSNTGEEASGQPDRHAVSAYANQPANLRQGVSQAITGMSRNVVTARDALVALPRDLEEQTGPRGAARVAVKSVPIALIRPLIGTTEMISKTLLGLRNTMNPEQRKLNDDKYK